MEMNNTLVRPIEEEMKVSYLDYSMSVIVGRALPDVRDGLKPVQRRILYAMHEMGLGSNKPYRKSARVVGEVLGKYHPHGDMAVYDALVRMAQEFTFRYPLIDGQGNFGSVDGDSPAAMRYTECRLSKIAEEMLHDLDKETVDYADNFDATLKEPTVLPSKFPNLLVNGCSGIAVGMSTNIPPHNLREIVDGIILLLDNPEAGDAEVMNFVKGPDFPTGGVIHGRKGIVEAYTKGRGLIKVRGRVKFEREKGKVRIVITEIPYHVNKASLVKEIADRVKDGRIIGISDLRDESDREGIRVVVEVRKGVDERVVLNQLYAHTSLQTTFGIINLALVDGRPKILSLRELLLEYIKHRKNVIRRRTEFELRKAKERAHIVEGLLTALAHIDDVITVIRRSKDAKEAQSRLMTTYLLSEKQAKAILSMQLQRLTRLEGEGLAKEHEELREKIKDYEDILRREERVIKIIKEELLEIKKKYGDDRRTDIEEEEEEIEIEDLIPEQNVVVMMTNKGYIKAVALDAYKKQHRGGVGLIGMETKDEDFVVRSFVSNTHDYILFFTDKGKVYWLKTYRVPLSERYTRGKPVINLIGIKSDESVLEAIPVSAFVPNAYVVFVTRRGYVKRTPLMEFSRPRRTGIRAIRLWSDDELVGVALCRDDDEIILGTKLGRAVRFSIADVRPMGRTARGVIGARLRKNDEVVSMTIARENVDLLTITEKGYGKRTKIETYRKTKRGSMGVITIKTGQRNGNVVAVLDVMGDEELIVTSARGMVIRFRVADIPVMGRNTMGVRIMRLKKGDRVVGVAKVGG